MRAVLLALLSLFALIPSWAVSQTPTNMTALRGLAPVAVLLKTAAGKAALAANLSVTGDIQTGVLKQPILLPWPEQQLHALRDAFITDGNAAELADGLGTKLGDAYQATARYEDWKTFTSVSQTVADLIGYTNNVTKADSNSGKFFFANLTQDGKKPVSETAAAMLTEMGGVPDVFGRAYGRPAGSTGADAFGNSRPFQTEPRLVAYRGPDYFGKPSHTIDWLRGPSQNLTDSPSYPSGHTTYGYTESLLLAVMVPERYQQMVARGAEYGNNRIVLGAHYAMDVLGGRTLALHDVAHLLANHPAYVGPPRTNPAEINAMGQVSRDTIAVTDYQATFGAARKELRAFLETKCGGPIAGCAQADTSRFKDAAANEAFYAVTQTYGLPVVYQASADRSVDIDKEAPEAGYLLTAAFPTLTLGEANAILTETLGPGGGFLDDGSAFGLYSRINLYAAAGKAAALASKR